MKASYVQRGNKIDYINDTGADIKRGEVVVLGGRIAVAADDIVSGKQGVLELTGVWAMAKASSEEIVVGAAVYYDKGNDCITTTADSNTLAGFAAEKKAAADTSIAVRIG